MGENRNGEGHMQGVDGKWGRLRGMQDAFTKPRKGAYMGVLFHLRSRFTRRESCREGSLEHDFLVFPILQQHELIQITSTMCVNVLSVFFTFIPPTKIICIKRRLLHA